MAFSDTMADKRVARALSVAIQQRTVSGGDERAFTGLHTVLRELFPCFFSKAECRTVNDRALLCRLPGLSDAKPLLFLSHMDVYPVRDAEKWKYQPFAGEMREGFVYGRGAEDMKGHLICLLTAIEGLLERKWQPQGDIWFAFSCDEETRGNSMRKMCTVLKEENVSPAFVLDEGGEVTQLSAYCTKDAAFIGVSEKGYIRFTLTAPGDQEVKRLLRAAGKLSHFYFKPVIPPVTKKMMSALSPDMSFYRRTCALHPSLCKPMILRDLDTTVPGRSMTRTQMAVSALQGDVRLGKAASITFQASVLPGQSAQALLRRVEMAIKDDGILVSVEQFDEPSFESPAAGPAWEALCTAVRVHYPDIRCVPYLVTGGTDARRMEDICPFIYRFSPFVLPPDELKRMHGTDERISIENLVRGTAFFRQMLQA